MMSRICRYAIAALCCVISAGAFAQGGGKPTGPTTPSRPTAPSSLPTQSQQQQQQLSRPIFIMGDVITGDGTPIPRNVEIHRICSGRDRREGYADSTGHFSFQLGVDTSVQDASSDDFGASIPGGNPGMSTMGMNQPSSLGGGPSLFGCELKATSPGFRSSVIELSSYRPEEPIVGKLVLERLERVPGTMISVTSAAAPKDAQKDFKKGMDLLKKGKPDEAMQHFTEATKIYPRYADAWVEIGQINLHQGQIDAAKSAFQQALSIDPKFVTPYIGLAGLEAQRQNWAEAARLSDQAIALDPIDFISGYFYNSVANYNLGNFDVAERTARKAATLDGQHHMPQIQSLLGRILLVKRDYPGALENFRGYLHLSPNAVDAADIRRQIQTLEQASAATPAPAAAQQPPRK